MDRKAGDDRINVPIGKRFAKVVFHNLWMRGLGREAMMQTVEHRRRGVEATARRPDGQREPARAGERRRPRSRMRFEVGGIHSSRVRLAFRAVGDRVRPGEIVECVFG